MKQRFLFIAPFLLCMQLSFATIRTVSNNPATIAQFNTIQLAITASVTGDTIYVHGSPNVYAAFTITNLRLIIIGPGWSPDKNLPLTAVISGGATLTGVGTTGTELQGLHIAGNVSIATLGVNNIRIIRNRLSSANFSLTPSVAGTISGYLFEGNWFDNMAVNSNGNFTLQNFIFQNNIFFESSCCVSASIGGFVNTINVLFDHNLWYGVSSGSRIAFTGGCRFLILTNNIFVRKNLSPDLSFSTFNNNITFNSGSIANDAPWTLNSNVNGGGNVAGTDPQMTDQTSVTGGTNNPLLDLSVAAGPANLSGSDGKDMGLLFDVSGSLNWLNSRNSRIPRIFSMNITTPTVAPGGNVSVTVESRRSN